MAFVLTGQYMDHVHSHLRGMADGPRLMFRSAHIYLLFAALLNIALGSYMNPLRERVLKALQVIGSVMVLFLPAMFLVSFFAESQNGTLYRPFARAAIYLSLLGITAHFIASLPYRESKDDTKQRRAA